MYNEKKVLKAKRKKKKIGVVRVTHIFMKRGKIQI